MKKAKLIILGLTDGGIGLPLVEGSGYWGRQILPVTNGVVGRSRALAIAQAAVPGLQEVYPRDLPEEGLGSFIDRETILVDASLDTSPFITIQRYGGLGAPLVILSERSSRQTIVVSDMKVEIEKLQGQGKKVAVLDAPGYTVLGWSHLVRLNSLPDYALQQMDVSMELMLSHPSQLACLIHDRLERLSNSRSDIRDLSSGGAHRQAWREVPREYLNSYQRIGYRIEREGSSEQCLMEFRGPKVFVEDFYRDLLPRFERALSSSRKKGGLGLIGPEALPRG